MNGGASNDGPSIARRREQLLRRIHQRFQTRTENIRIGDTLRISFTRIADPDRVLDEVAEEEDRRERASGERREGDSLHLPYWAELWDSALGIGQYLVQTGLDARQALRPSVLDLGCGMGLSGTVAAALGAHVLFADLEPAALLFASLNSVTDERRVRTRRVNWRTDELGESFDLILGADIVYERQQWPFLEPFWRAHLKPGGAVLLGEPGRQTGEAFVQWIQSQGWTLRQSQQQVPTRAVPIRILRLTRAA